MDAKIEQMVKEPRKPKVPPAKKAALPKTIKKPPTSNNNTGMAGLAAELLAKRKKMADE